MTTTYDEVARSGSFLARVFGWVALGFTVTFAVAYVVASVDPLLSEATFGLAFVGTLAIVLVLDFWSSIPVRLAEALYVPLTALFGLALAPVFWLVPAEVLGAAFVATGGAFAAAATVGLVVRRDLGAVGMVLALALIGLVGASLVNVVWVQSALPFAGVVLFTLLTAYDVWWAKTMGEWAADEDEANRLAVLGALAIYLDLLNLLLYFLQLLAIFGAGDD